MPEKVESTTAKLYTQRGHRLFWLTKKISVKTQNLAIVTM